MPRRLTGVLAAVLSLGYVALSVYWVEAEKEVRILCGFIRPGMTAQRAVEALETGNLLRYAGRRDAAAPATTDAWSHIDVWSPRTLGTSRCSVSLAHGEVRASEYATAFRLERAAAGVATAALVGVVMLHLLLAGGAPLGKRAWGGRHRVLPPGLRVASGVSALVLAGAVVAVWERVGALNVLGGRSAADPAVWALFFLFLVSALANARSRSAMERRMGLSLSVLLAAALLLVALGP